MENLTSSNEWLAFGVGDDPTKKVDVGVGAVLEGTEGESDFFSSFEGDAVGVERGDEVA